MADYLNYRTQVWLLACACLLTVLGVAKANAAPSHVVTRATAKVSLDGALDEAAWSAAQNIGEIKQREPQEGVAATERTEVKLLTDDDNLYIGIHCFDAAPEKVVGTQMARDGDLDADDTIEILLDTFHDRRNAFYFATNPAGALVDGLIIENSRRINFDWNAIWEVKAKRRPDGWSAEFALPFKSLSFNPGQDTWGFNVSRTIVRKLEEDRWAAPRLDARFTQVSEAGEISGLAEAQQGRGLDARPYVAGRFSRENEGGNALQGKAGGEVFYNITSGLRFTGTINTDFAETEVDNRQINLTRFPLFFPEKRAFFLENVGVFSFGSGGGFGGGELIPFFSRRIGLAEGREVPITAGGRLTGKVGQFDVGVLGVRTRAAGDIPAKNFFVGRVKRKLFTQSYVGGIYTNGDPADATGSRTLGADVNLSTANFLGNRRNFNLGAYYLQTNKEGVTGDNKAYGVSANYPNDRWDFFSDARHVGASFSPALGFVPRRAVDRLFLGAVYKPRPKKFLNVRQMFNEFFFTGFRRNDFKRVESWRLFTAPLNWEFNSGERVEANWVRQFERLFAPFEIADGVTIPAGGYRYDRFRLEFETASKRPWEVSATWWFGTFFTGRSHEISTDFVYKLAPHLRVALSADQTFARLPQGNFVARVLTARADYAFTPLLTLSNFVQFDNESRNLGWQSRVRWILKPGNDLFLVFNQGWQQNPRGGFSYRAANTRLTGKLQYTLRF